MHSGIAKLKEELKNEVKMTKHNSKKKGDTSPNDKDDYPYTTEFFKLLALCHTVVCDNESSTGEIKY